MVLYHTLSKLQMVEKLEDVDNLRARYENTKNSGSNTFDSFDPLVFPDVPDSVVDSPPPSPPVTQQSEPEHSELRRSTRTRQPPDYYGK